MMILPNEILFKEVEAIVKDGGTVKLKLVGHSMYPFLRDSKDSVILAPFKKEDLRCGSVALFKYRETYILHRIVSIDNDIYTFCGDGNIGLTESADIDSIVALMTSVEYLSGRKRSCNSFLWRSSSYIWQKVSYFRRYLLWLCRTFY